jgi:3'DNA-binding domain (3'BD)
MKKDLSETAQPTPSSGPIAKVVLDVPLARSFDFLAPGLDVASIGRLVIVPFGRANSRPDRRCGGGN